jgi:hypothetical protein
MGSTNIVCVAWMLTARPACRVSMYILLRQHNSNNFFTWCQVLVYLLRVSAPGALGLHSITVTVYYSANTLQLTTVDHNTRLAKAPQPQPTFLRNISPPSSGSKNKPNKKPARKQVACRALLVSCSAYPSTLKMEAICSSETSVDFQRTTRRYIPEDSILSKTSVDSP